MNLGTLIRSVIPQHTRARLRRHAMVRKLLSMRYGGVQSRPFPHGPFQIWFDGDRDLDLAVSSFSGKESHEIDFVRELLRKNPVNCAWDVGANIGYWTLFFAGIEPKIQQIVSFEPDEINRGLLQMNIDRNHLADVTVRPCGLSDRVGSATFHTDPATGATGSLEADHDFIGKWYGQERKPVEIEISTIDAEVDRLDRPPGFIKIDVESHELSVLQGATNTMSKHRPMVIVEVSANHDAIRDLLAQHDYQMLDASTGKEIDRPAWSTVALPRKC
jgi:FkbM family methyltransferase